jgi:hypothetical protein
MKLRKSLSKPLLSTWDWSDTTTTQANWSTLLPQATALVADLPLVAGTSGLVDPQQTIQSWKNLTKNETYHFNGELINWTTLAFVVKYLLTSPRGNILDVKQTDRTGLRWCAAVPLVLAAHKEYNSVPYERWDWNSPHMVHFLDKDLQGVLQYRLTTLPWSRDELEGFYHLSLQIKSGKKAGTIRNPLATSTVYNVDDETFKSLPRLVKLLILQLWCYHPSVRHNLMITDLANFDNCSPPPLVSDDVVDTKMLSLEDVWA